jgi:hypothetical protein
VRRRLLWPVADDRVALAFTQHTTIHASADRPLVVAKGGRPEARSVCGSDVYPYIVGIDGRDDMAMVMPWPPPPERRCEDCCRLLGGTPRKARGGWGSWEHLS